MRIPNLVPRLLIAALAMGFAFAGYAGDSDVPEQEKAPAVDKNTKDVPDAKKALKKVVSEVTAKTAKSSFNVTCNVQGGISFSKDHKISNTTVSEDYNANVYRGIMYLPAHDVYRTPERGTIRGSEKDVWKDTLADKNVGTKVEKFLQFPHKLLETALDKSDKIEWVWVGDEEEIVENESEGRTGVVERRYKLPHMLRVELPEAVALEQFTQVQNSGCMGGG
ncbi:MAG: hypothetical protein L0Z55_07775 [Planctomycetes bacterium]|nr:hypothetical protein [Planctomycetota bacterium]